VEMLLYVAIYATAGATVLMLLVVFFFLVGARLRLTGRYSQVQLLYSATRLFKSNLGTGRIGGDNFTGGGIFCESGQSGAPKHNQRYSLFGSSDAATRCQYCGNLFVLVSFDSLAFAPQFPRRCVRVLSCT